MILFVPLFIQDFEIMPINYYATSQLKIKIELKQNV